MSRQLTFSTFDEQPDEKSNNQNTLQDQLSDTAQSLAIALNELSISNAEAKIASKLVLLLKDQLKSVSDSKNELIKASNTNESELEAEKRRSIAFEGQTLQIPSLYTEIAELKERIAMLIKERMDVDQHHLIVVDQFTVEMLKNSRLYEQLVVSKSSFDSTTMKQLVIDHEGNYHHSHSL